jgi:hypothetical protein
VEIVDLPHMGATGWMLANGAHGDDGKPSDQFEGAVIAIR